MYARAIMMFDASEQAQLCSMHVHTIWVLFSCTPVFSLTMYSCNWCARAGWHQQCGGILARYFSHSFNCSF
jgi:hypothetical protein